VALLGGALVGLAIRHPFAESARSASRILLQACVVGLGFGMNWHDVLAVSQSCFVLTALGIALTLVLGLWLGRSVGVRPVPSLLVAVGTAICGGSAIAAIGPSIGAREDEMSVSLGAVFALNACALLLFPPLGLWLGLSEVRVKYPWFISFFCLAVLLNSHLELARPLFDRLHHTARLALSVTLFLIGSSISTHALRQLGGRLFLLALALWYLVAVATLGLVRGGHVSL
jgi:uncharacterized membrane protein YadS